MRNLPFVLWVLLAPLVNALVDALHARYTLPRAMDPETHSGWVQFFVGIVLLVMYVAVAWLVYEAK